ncbi:hypothetical protein BJF93_09575 [Xaviernesmea oryzae]|uniref:Type II toxin-antitoxin system ParD family antitoxin n=1 Tax=Xaviernesmea oryzae TaxID=464029 RepID=A0A1Q9AWL8_9HYPH|nr:type II toxin-antitoxin system ParD family antitoxin [Xaviernesmea oryzae]OLP59852.1 hypothetical protein BJF93_09575 [Xaviernesmea oryzae]SEK48930.1 antitoxin ParD1/3/4 [Xaviernesmea oryzae]
MAQAKTFSLGDPYDAILADLVRTGRFKTEADAVKAGLRMLADDDNGVRALRQNISEADAEIEAGLGKEYRSGAELMRDVMSEGEAH